MGSKNGKGSMRNGEPLHAALKRDFERGKRELGISADSVGSDFDLSAEAIWKLCSEGAGRLPREMKAIVAWHYATGGIEALKWLAAECGCIVTRLPEGHRMEGTSSQVMHEVADLLNEIGLAMDDGAVTTDEAAKIEREGTEAIIAIQGAIEQAKRLSINGRAMSLKAASR